MEKIKFTDLPLSEELLRALADMKFEDASPIQAEAIPVALTGQDIIGLAQTGTGKTAAFGIPALELLDPTKNHVQVLVLCPTRELALQVTDQIQKLARYKNIQCVTIYGGDSIERQIRELKRGMHVVVGTPGRVIDHIERKTLKLDKVRISILDEADEMLDMGFLDDIESILEQLPEKRQTLLFSATMSKEILQITKRFQREPQLIKVVKKELTADNIEQLFYEIKAKAKVEVMCRLMDLYNLHQVIVFCNTKSKVDEVVEELLQRGYEAEGLHGDMRQQARTNVMTKFRSSHTNILVATDVAARGIDVSGVDAVVNYDIPLDPEYYVHRIGRTGRAGKSGKAFTFVVGREFVRLREIENYTKVKIVRGVVPSFADVVGMKKAKFIDRIKAAVEEGDLELFDDMIQPLHHSGLSDHDIIKALIKMNMGIQKTEHADVELSDLYERNKGGREEKGKFGRKEEKPFAKNRREGNRRNGEMVRLFINIGKADRVRPNDIVGALTGETGIAYDNIGHIDIYEKYSFVDIASHELNKVLEGMENNTIKGKQVNIELAKG
jgi:ATP-dependent RNA helicase DeaD